MWSLSVQCLNIKRKQEKHVLLCVCGGGGYFLCFVSQKCLPTLLVSFMVFTKVPGIQFFPWNILKIQYQLGFPLAANNKLKEVNYLNLFPLRYVKTRGMQSWMGRVSTNCPQRARLLLSCSAILSMWLSSSRSQDSCCTSRHHILHSRKQKWEWKGQTVCQLSLSLFLREKSHPRRFWLYLTWQNCHMVTASWKEA